MKTLLGLLAVLGLATTPGLAQTVSLDYAREFDFNAVKTFQYVNTAETNINDSLMADRVVSSIKKTLRERGLNEVQDNGDLVVTYHFSSRTGQSFTTTTMGMGRGGRGAGWGHWGGAGMATSTTQVNTFTEGTLVIDTYDPEEEKLVWRGSGTVTLKAKPEKQIQQMNKVLKKLGGRWDKILAGKGK